MTQETETNNLPTVTATENFKTHYANIKQIAGNIKSQDEPDIDALVPMVDAALKSYAFCKERLSAVKALLGEKLPSEAG